MISIKSKIRKLMLEQRSLLSQSELYSKSSIIIDKLICLDVYINAKVIMCYVDFKNEVMTKDFLRQSLSLGKIVAVPCVVDDNNMLAVQIFDMDKDLQSGKFGIPEPIYPKAISSKEIDLIIIPGVAFDKNKNRIGYGKGYYDRYLQNIKSDCVKVGIAFEEQICNNIPVEDCDVQMDIVITDARIM